MLKIKEDKMQELEKFGFKKEDDYWVYIEDEPKKNWCKQTINNLIGVSTKSDYIGVMSPVYIARGQIVFSSESFSEWNTMKTLGKLYDLIKADMVEKDGE